MRKLFHITVACLVLLPVALFSAIDPNVSFSLLNSNITTSGTYNSNATFTLTVFGTWSGFSANGYSLWLETNSALAPFISIISETYFTFTNPSDNGFPKVFNDAAGRTNNGFLTEHDTVANPQTGTINSGDLGATGVAAGAGTHELAMISFQLSDAPTGTYTLETGTASPKGSEFNDTSFTTHFAASDVYVISVVPEPATLSLLGISGLGSLVLRYKRKK
jgi:hypothetical protein